MLQEVFRLANLERAWRWVRSNPDPVYKHYFRDFYAAFAVADAGSLADLRNRLREDTYQPSHATKLYLPKPSGILRPFSLLAVEDQIVYQAFGNVIAERLSRRMAKQYLVTTFSHIYAGRNSPWFYKKWTDGYKAFNDAVRKAVADGFDCSASFDLTACYDSLDHGVLSHFLGQLGCDPDFCQRLTRYLSHWTATHDKIYQHHGIPQGPPPSGILAEAVLRFFDQNHGSHERVRYLRYVDDIRLFARTERELRRMLIRLDHTSKSVGLFPQSSKIHIHRITNVEAELKTISNPSEPAVRRFAVNQNKLRKRIAELTPRFRIRDITRFKFLLAHALPSSKLNGRVWRIYKRYPELFVQVLSYFARYEKLPRSVAVQLIEELPSSDLYPAVTAAILGTLTGRVTAPSDARAIDRHARSLWKPRTSPADLTAAVARWAIPRGLLSNGRIRYALKVHHDWWCRARIISELNRNVVGSTFLTDVVAEQLRDNVGDVATSAAMVAIHNSVTVHVRKGMNAQAVRTLKAFGLAARAPQGPCLLEANIERILGRPSAIANWRAIFGREYVHARRQIVLCAAESTGNASGFINALDVFNDMLLSRLYARDPSLGTYQTGNVGSILSSTRLRSQYPAVFTLVSQTHEKRLETYLSHPKVRKTGKRTGRVPYRFIGVARGLLRQGLNELAAKW